MKLLKSIKPIQYVTLAYAALYTLFVASGLIQGDYSPLAIGIYLFFIPFVIGFSLSWYNGMITGILFIVWNIGMWIVECFFVEKDGGWGIIFGVPLLILGVLFIVGEYKTRKDPPPTKSQLWNMALKLLVTTFTILYLVWVISSFIPNQETDLFIWPGVILTVLLAIYLIGFLLSWRWELIAGILFIIWYAGLYIPDLQPIAYFIGPLKFFGLPVFIQGILYLNYHYRFKFKLL